MILVSFFLASFAIRRMLLAGCTAVLYPGSMPPLLRANRRQLVFMRLMEASEHDLCSVLWVGGLYMYHLI